jgi:hypothetical protein
MSQAYVNQLTIDCLLNKDLINKHIKNKQSKKENKEDIKFYKKRIYNLFKEIITGNSPDDLLPDVKYAYSNFLNASISYFKTVDNNDIIQSEYKDMDFSPEIRCTDNDISGNVINADKLLMRSIKIDAPTLDKYVTRVITKKKEEIILPKQRNINLNDPEFKNKGLKKNNITNIYEDKNTKKEIQEK